MANETLYDILQVSKTADIDIIDAAYTRLREIASAVLLKPKLTIAGQRSQRARHAPALGRSGSACTWT